MLPSFLPLARAAARASQTHGLPASASAAVAAGRRALSSSAGAAGAGGGRIVCVSSGKGGVGKTTTTASLGYSLAALGKKTCVVDLDIGLRNLDIHLGCERRVIFDFVNVLLGECTLRQALIQDKGNDKLHLLAASQTRDKTVLTLEGVGRIVDELREEFDYVLLDSPAGIESGAYHAMYYADEAVLVTNPELSSCRDSDKMVGFIASRSRRAEQGEDPVKQSLLVTRYSPSRVADQSMLALDDIEDLLGLPLLGVVPESTSVLTGTNLGTPVASMPGDDAGQAYSDAAARMLGETRDMRFTTLEEKSFLQSLFGR